MTRLYMFPLQTLLVAPPWKSVLVKTLRKSALERRSSENILPQRKCSELGNSPYLL